MRVRITEKQFDPQAETSAFVTGRQDAGALVSFVGYCRDSTAGRAVQDLFIDHYGAFTDREIARIAQEVTDGYDIIDALLIHRVGRLLPGDAIVLVAVLSKHRRAAFEAASALMDRLKTDAPLWKKETGPDGARWVEPSEEDHRRRAMQSGP